MLQCQPDFYLMFITGNVLIFRDTNWHIWITEISKYATQSVREISPDTAVSRYILLSKQPLGPLIAKYGPRKPTLPTISKMRIKKV